MPRPPARPTLKLPVKPANRDDATDSRPPSRKPVRGGFKAAKLSAAENASRLAARTSRPPAPETPPHRVEARPEIRTSAARREEPAPRPAKIYPKRGIARSMGARALPPARTDNDRPVAAPVAEAPRLVPPPVSHTDHRDLKSAPTLTEPVAPRRPLKEPPRLAKRLSEMTQCSRREADEWIENGWVRVDGVVVTTLGTRAHPSAKIEILEQASKHQTEYVTILFNKPPDAEIDTASAVSMINTENRWAEDSTAFAFKATHLRGMALAGKLDAASTGMLVLTQEGSVARRITGDETRLEKEYMVRVEGELSPEGMKLLNLGLALDEIKLKRAQVSWQNEQQLRFVLHESRKDQIQRMCELVGLRVVSIKRIRIGSVSLGKLPVGQWRYLRANERF